MSRYRQGARVQSLRWTDVHGTVVRVEGEWLGVRWDGTQFTEDEAHVDEVKPSRRPAPPDSGPGYLVVRRGR